MDMRLGLDFLLPAESQREIVEVNKSTSAKDKDRLCERFFVDFVLR